jgi:hypothetical protein
VGGRQVERDVRAPAAQADDVRAVEQHRVRRAGEELPEDVLDLAERSVGRVVVELHVGHHRHLDPQGEHRRSDSSASTTSHGPVPQSALWPVVESVPPIR